MLFLSRARGPRTPKVSTTPEGGRSEQRVAGRHSQEQRKDSVGGHESDTSLPTPGTRLPAGLAPQRPREQSWVLATVGGMRGCHLCGCEPVTSVELRWCACDSRVYRVGAAVSWVVRHCVSCICVTMCRETGVGCGMCRVALGDWFGEWLGAGCVQVAVRMAARRPM